MGQGGWIYGITYTWGHLSAVMGTYGLELFGFNKEGEVDRKSFVVTNTFIQEMLPDVSSLIEKKGKLYIKVKNGYCYFEVKNVKGTVVNNSIACVHEYYLLDNGRLVKSNLDFKGEYLKEVTINNKILQEKAWKENNWFSPLLGRTLNLIFGGEEEKAWQEFFENFEKFSKKYPSEEIEKINPNKIKEEIEKQLEERGIF